MYRLTFNLVHSSCLVNHLNHVHHIKAIDHVGCRLINVQRLLCSSQAKAKVIINESHEDNSKDLHHQEVEYIISDKANLEWKQLEAPTSLQNAGHYLKLSKFRLTSLVVLTTLAGYTMGCTSFDPILASASLIGTGLTSASAACLNQFLEIPFDSQMMRTRNRPLVLGQLSPARAMAFSMVSGTVGLTILATMVNPLTAALGAFNLILYSFVYTPMKRANIANTWVGSIVGAIPPIMGYTAAANVIGTLHHQNG